MNLAIKLPNGETVEGKTEEWLAAVLLVLSDDQRNVVMDRMRKKMIVYRTPGSHVLQVGSSAGLVGFTPAERTAP